MSKQKETKSKLEQMTALRKNWAELPSSVSVIWQECDKKGTGGKERGDRKEMMNRERKGQRLRATQPDISSRCVGGKQADVEKITCPDRKPFSWQAAAFPRVRIVSHMVDYITSPQKGISGSTMERGKEVMKNCWSICLQSGCPQRRTNRRGCIIGSADFNTR